MYDARELLQSIDAHASLFMTLSTITLIFNYVFFVAAIMAGNRDRAFPFPLVACTLWFAHDVTYLLAYREWFEVYDHWYLKMFWWGLFPTSAIEAVYIWQVWRYGHDELMPGTSRQAFTLYVLAAIGAGAIAFYSLRNFMADPIFAYTFGTTGYLAVVFNIPRLLAKRDARGQSVVMWLAYLGMQGTWFVTTYMIFGQQFREAPYLVIGAGCALGGIFMVLACLRLKQAEPARGSLGVAGLASMSR
jgi:hypothetical protein